MQTSFGCMFLQLVHQWCELVGLGLLKQTLLTVLCWTRFNTSVLNATILPRDVCTLYPLSPEIQIANMMLWLDSLWLHRRTSSAVLIFCSNARHQRCIFISVRHIQQTVQGYFLKFSLHKMCSTIIKWAVVTLHLCSSSQRTNSSRECFILLAMFYISLTAKMNCVRRNTLEPHTACWLQGKNSDRSREMHPN